MTDILPQNRSQESFATRSDKETTLFTGIVRDGLSFYQYSSVISSVLDVLHQIIYNYQILIYREEVTYDGTDDIHFRG